MLTTVYVILDISGTLMNAMPENSITCFLSKYDFIRINEDKQS